jgi:hypothetical protein
VCGPAPAAKVRGMSLTYHDGQPVQLRDRVDLDGTPATVLDIVDTAERQASWGLKEPMVFFDSERDGQVLQAPCDRGWEGVILLGRANPPPDPPSQPVAGLASRALRPEVQTRIQSTMIWLSSLPWGLSCLFKFPAEAAGERLTHRTNQSARLPSAPVAEAPFRFQRWHQSSLKQRPGERYRQTPRHRAPPCRARIAAR